jgi:hypothetical protein
VKLFGAGSPDLRLTASTGGKNAMMGDALEEESATFEAQVLGGATSVTPRQLVIMRDGTPFLTVPVVGQAFSFSFTSVGPGDYRIQVMRGSAIDGLTNPITLGARPEPKPPPGSPPGTGPGSGPPGKPSGEEEGGESGGKANPSGPSSMSLRASPVRARAGRKVRFKFVVMTRGLTQARVAGAVVRFGGKKTRTDSKGIARITVRHMRTGRKRASASKPGLGKAVAKLRVLRAKTRR